VGSGHFSLIVFSFFLVSLGLFSFSENAFAAEISVPAGTSVPGCEETNECWDPPVVTVGVGETVTWSNDDTAAHTVTSGGAPYLGGSGPDGNFDSSLFMAGTTFEWTPDAEGEYPYYCMVHPWMEGSVIVQAAGAEAPKDDLMINIKSDRAVAGESMTIKVEFVDMQGLFRTCQLQHKGNTRWASSP